MWMIPDRTRATTSRALLWAREMTPPVKRLVAGELQMADVRQQVALSLITEFENFSAFKPGDYNLDALSTLLDQVVAWSAALAPLRETAPAA